MNLLTIIVKSAGGLRFASPFTNIHACVWVFGNDFLSPKRLTGVRKKLREGDRD